MARRGALVHMEALGYRDASAGVAMTEDTLFWAASMTKPMTVVAALMLHERGELLIDDPMGKYLPEFGAMRVASVVKDASGSAAIETIAAERQPTILDLMCHTSGIVEGFLGTTPVHTLYRDAVGDGMTAFTGAEFITRLSPLPLLHQPGAVWHYGWGLDLLGLIIESITKQSLGSYLRENLFNPLEMHDTSFGVPQDKAARYAKPLPRDPLTGEAQSLPDLSRARFDSGGAGIVTTAGDYLQFARMLAGGGALGDVRVLGRKTVEHMLSDHLGPTVDGRAIAEVGSPLEGYGFGLGVAVRRTRGIAPAMGSVGDVTWPGAGGTYWWVDPKEQLAVVFMAHTPGRAHCRHYHRLIRALVMQTLVD